MDFTTTKMTEQYVQNMYSKTSSKTAYTKNNKAAAATASVQNSETAASYEGSVVQQPKATYSKPMAVTKKQEEKKDDLQAKLDKTYEALSDKAKEYLASLKEKFGDIDFFVADCESDTEMNHYFAMGTKKYSCVISSSLIEKMATDDTAREKYEKIIANAGEQIEEMKAEAKDKLGEEAAEQIEFVGFTVKDDGVVEYFAKLRNDNNSYYAKLKEKRAEAKEEEKKAEEKRNEKLAEEKRIHKNDDLWFTADSKESLLTAIREALGIESSEEKE